MLVNARFVAVPSHFKVDDITETVLGDLGVSLCDLGHPVQRLLFGADGSCRLNNATLQVGRTSLSPRLAVTLEEWVCNRKGASAHCDWSSSSRLAHQVATPFKRVAISTPDMEVELQRQAVARIVPPAVQQHLSACDALPSRQQISECREQVGARYAHNKSTVTPVNELDIFQQTAQDASFVFGFTEVHTKMLKSRGLPVHGLLGQRSGEAGSVAKSEAYVDGSSTLVGAMQGQGFIQGHYTDYQIQEDDLHGSNFRYNHFYDCECLDCIGHHPIE